MFLADTMQSGTIRSQLHRLPLESLPLALVILVYGSHVCIYTCIDQYALTAPPNGCYINVWRYINVLIFY